MNKYTKLKIEFEKQKQYNIQLNLNLRNYKRRGSTPDHTIISHKNKNCDLKIIRFSLNYANKNNNNNKLTEKKKGKNDIKKLNEEFAKFKNECNIKIEKKV